MRLRSYVVTAFGLGLLALVMTFSPTREALAEMTKPLLVHVVNTSAEPIPVTGTTNVSGPVIIGNSAESPVLVRDIGATAVRPFQLELCAGSTCTDPGDTFTVPSTERRVIEFVAGRCFGTAGAVLTSLILSTTVADVRAGYTLHGPQSGSAGFDAISIFARQVRIYADAGSTIVLAQGFASFGGMVCSASVSGYAY